ncbi:Lrp/AsnC family transcriptional regulator [Pseudonocardia acaciae]|uniref:Lrp/AsnC family transcriptional regulator n=1 Tax=Pseudonocardia acaciae TaxID=551276 RepID=UPI00048AD91C|nr:Lrp/AsnC family transcriptional regulator [Pseudonocardia acaciae]
MDLLDRQLIRALKVDGRASLRRIAAVLGASDQRLARRYTRLHADGVLRVRARLDPRRLGHVEWIIRLHCVPPATLSIARALARRDDTHWVRLASGGTEIMCNVEARSDRDRDTLLLNELPATRRVTAIGAHRVLRGLRGGRNVWPVPAGVLDQDQLDRLAPPPPDLAGTPVELDDGDRALAAELARDGRAPHALLAAKLGRHESTVRRRIAHLRASGALYFDVELDDRRLGYATSAVLWISVEPSALDAAGRAIAELPEVPFAAATTGPHNLVASLLCTDDDSLYDCISRRIGSLPGVRAIETAPIIRTVKRVGLE